MSLGRRAFEACAQFIVGLAVLIFLPAWTLRYWQGWLFLAVFTASLAVVTVYFLKRDPALIERRLRAGPAAEKRPSQKRIQAIAAVFFFLLVPVSALDHRFGWLDALALAALIGNVLVVLGFAAIFLVFRENSFASGAIEIADDQRLVSTGPYRVVRHPMYAGAIVLIAGIPLALGSYGGLLLCIPLAAAIVVRLLDEERYLRRHLPGYVDYVQRTRYRLAPGIF